MGIALPMMQAGHIAFEVVPDDGQVQRFTEAMRDLASGREIAKATANAVNRALDRTKTETVRYLIRDMAITRDDLLQPHRFGARSGGTAPPVSVSGANISRLSGYVRVSSRRIPVVFLWSQQVYGGLGRFRRGRYSTGLSMKQTTRTGITRPRHGVRWQAWKGKWSYERLAFMGRGRRGGGPKPGTGGTAELGASGHVGVFRRKAGAKRLPIRELKGPSIPWVVQKSPTLRAAMAPGGAISIYYAERMTHELNRIVDRYRAQTIMSLEAG